MRSDDAASRESRITWLTQRPNLDCDTHHRQSFAPVGAAVLADVVIFRSRKVPGGESALNTGNNRD